MKKPKVYLCARVSKDAHEMNEKIMDSLSPYFDVFAPHKKEAELEQPKDPVKIYNLDLDGMDNAEICMTIAPYGKDCSWEMGYFVGQRKSVFMYVPDIESIPTKEWMISGGVSVIITHNKSVYDDCRGKFDFLVIVSSIEHMGDTLNRYYKNGGR